MCFRVCNLLRRDYAFSYICYVCTWYIALKVYGEGDFFVMFRGFRRGVFRRARALGWRQVVCLFVVLGISCSRDFYYYCLCRRYF